jgi:hypothetical protein
MVYFGPTALSSQEYEVSSKLFRNGLILGKKINRNEVA